VSVAYEFLLPYTYSDPDEEQRRLQGKARSLRTGFYRVAEGEIVRAEKELGFPFPSELRDFYSSIGYGFLDESPISGEIVSRNYVIRPCVLAQAMRFGDDPPLFVPDYGTPRHGFPLDCIPCIDRGDGCFLYMKPTSRFPNQVWGVLGDRLLSESFQRLIEAMFIDPWYPDRVAYPESFGDRH
jgi:hypothetical protein